MKAWARAALALAAVALAGCRNLAEITGLATGAIAGGASANPAVGYAVGFGTVVAADAAFKYISRVRAHAEQQAIADAAGDLPDGGMASWRIEHTIPIGNEHGDVRVVRTFATPLATCREIVFSVLDSPPTPPALYDTDLCRDTGRWEWASAEPAVPRWGSLQ